ncbi:MAG: DNA repair protein RecN [Winogradskyella sp.]
MLTSLYIKNYALIDELNVSFKNGLTIITGETGAGKSILLGGLSLVLGKRADLSQVKIKDYKCIIEATFDIANYNLKRLFETLDLDYEVQTIIRREISPSGKSRAFINDTPVTLDDLSKLSNHLIDIHSQHQTQELTKDDYQFKVLDALANNSEDLQQYSTQLLQFKSLEKELEHLIKAKSELIKEYDYNLYLLKELEEVKLETIRLEQLEETYESLNNVELIGEKLNATKAILNTEDVGVMDQLNMIQQELTKLTAFGKIYETLYDRVSSVNIELNDISSELDNLEESLITDPQELERVSNTLQTINNLMQKHSVSTVEELIVIKANLETKVSNTESLDDDIALKETEIATSKKKLGGLASMISNKRRSIIPKLINKLEMMLNDLGMPNAKFKIELQSIDRFLSNGTDELQFLFMANKGSSFNELKKSASGGELSRIMLALKAILAEYIQLPSIMFDEIDTGVSGEISHKMGSIMKQMSSRMQVFAITHLPQIASKGSMHFKVYKTDSDDTTHTNLKQLNEDERIVEIAQMLGGLNVTESALAHAKQLLN